MARFSAQGNDVDGDLARFPPPVSRSKAIAKTRLVKRTTARTRPRSVAVNSGTVLVEVVVLEDAVEELLVEVLEVVVVLVLVVVLVEVMLVVDVTANIAEACSWRTCALPLRVKETRS